MKVVSKSEASRIAGVSRQAIYSLQKINTENKKKYPFFVFNPEDGKAGINIDHKDWIDYLNRNQSIRVKKKVQRKKLIRKDKGSIPEGYVNLNRVLDAVVKALDEAFDMTSDDLDEVKNLIDKYYEEG